MKKAVESVEKGRSDQKEFRAVLNRAEAGDSQALAEVRGRIQEVGFANDGIGNLAVRAEEALIEHLGKNSLLRREAMKLKKAKMRREFAGPDPSPLEQLLAERIALCWFQVNETILFQTAADDAWKTDAAEMFAARQERAHRQLMSAIKTLAQVRRLALPVLQVNVAERQVNQVNIGQTGGGG